MVRQGQDSFSDHLAEQSLHNPKTTLLNSQDRVNHPQTGRLFQLEGGCIIFTSLCFA